MLILQEEYENNTFFVLSDGTGLQASGILILEVQGKQSVFMLKGNA